MSESGNMTSSLENFVKSLLFASIQELRQNLTHKEEIARNNQEDTVGAVTFVMVFIAIFSFFIVSILVIAIRSRSYDQLDEQFANNFNMVDSGVGRPLFFQGAKCVIHENKTAE
ncbi:potassium voltage-gated channel subfamily E member 2-like [Anomaloglossus baeobatrachus]|uniref:potassium voltage-gated channel subfamily E member 2-like n=1 Tax=Anomaloglossus baeobatrachus TaxID=238106 RepID=UPI003F4FF5E7